MGVARYRYAHTEARHPSARIPQHILCDLEAELPTVDVGEGDTAYAKDSDKLFKRTGAAWVEVAGGGSVTALDDVGDVNAPTPGDGEALTWNAATSKWIPAAGGSVPDATTTVKGKVELATDGESLAGVVVQGNDARLSDSRTPLSHFHVDGDLPAGLARDSEVVAAFVVHEAAADPHAGYQKESEKGAANGYASLGAGGLVPAAQLATGTPDGTKYFRDDQTWQAVSGGSGLTHAQVLARGLGA